MKNACLDAKRPPRQEPRGGTKGHMPEINPLRECFAQILQLTHYIIDANTTLSDIVLIKQKARDVEKLIDGMYKVYKL
jgi:hypothetical protein